MNLPALLAAGMLFLSPGQAESVSTPVLDLPYRSQMNGTAYATSNCGPTSVAMVLGYYGVDASLWDVRVKAMKAQKSWVDDEGGYSDDYGVFIQHLATVVESYGLRTSGLWKREGSRIDRLREWQPADVKKAVENGQPVVVLVTYRSLPGRANTAFFGDHYVVVHGVAPNGDLIYSDPMDRNGGGPRVTISEEALSRAMSRTQAPRSAFAVYKKTDAPALTAAANPSPPPLSLISAQ